MGTEQIITYLTPFIVYLATWVVGKIKPLIPGWLMLTVVSVFSSLLAYVNQLLGNNELEWLPQFLLGLGAVIISQLIKQLSPSKIKKDNLTLKGGI